MAMGGLQRRLRNEERLFKNSQEDAREGGAQPSVTIKGGASEEGNKHAGAKKCKFL